MKKPFYNILKPEADRVMEYINLDMCCQRDDIAWLYYKKDGAHCDHCHKLITPRKDFPFFKRLKLLIFY